MSTIDVVGYPGEQIIMALAFMGQSNGGDKHEPKDNEIATLAGVLRDVVYDATHFTSVHSPILAPILWSVLLNLAISPALCSSCSGPHLQVLGARTSQADSSFESISYFGSYWV